MLCHQLRIVQKELRIKERALEGVSFEVIKTLQENSAKISHGHIMHMPESLFLFENSIKILIDIRMFILLQQYLQFFFIIFKEKKE